MAVKKQNFTKNPIFIRNLFDSISAHYDKLNDIMSLGLHNRIKLSAIKNLMLPTIPRILDLCTGTGDLAYLLSKEYPNSKVIGIDFSEKMLEIARKKHSDLEFIEGDCTQLPFEEKSFDLCVISFGLRNIEDIEKALKEIHRVLKTEGIFINLDLGKPNRFFNIVLKPYMYIWVAFLGKFFHGDETPYKYLAVSNESFPSPKELVELYEKIGFTDIKNKNYAFGQIASQICSKA